MRFVRTYSQRAKNLHTNDMSQRNKLMPRWHKMIGTMPKTNRAPNTFSFGFFMTLDLTHFFHLNLNSKALCFGRFSLPKDTHTNKMEPNTKRTHILSILLHYLDDLKWCSLWDTLWFIFYSWFLSAGIRWPMVRQHSPNVAIERAHAPTIAME